MSAANITKGIEAVGRALLAIERNANKQLTLESMIFTLSYLVNEGKLAYTRSTRSSADRQL